MEGRRREKPSRSPDDETRATGADSPPLMDALQCL